MKIQVLISLSTALLLSPTAAPAAEPAKTSEARVGVYDSRIVSFAHFWSEPARKERDALIASAKAAKAAGETARCKELEQQIVAGQKRSHLQVFSTAPADEAIALLKDRLPAMQQELGVARFVSKWDEAALLGIPESNRVDATDRLVRELLPQPDEKRRKTMAEMTKVKPMPLEQATRLADAGKM